MIFRFITALVVISRPLNMMLTAFSVYFTAFLTGISLSDYMVSVTVFIAVSTAAAGNIINDVFDLEIDRINRKDRILPSGRMSLISAITVYFLLLFLTISLAAVFLNSPAFLMVLFTNLLLWFYSFKLKKMPLTGNICVAGILGLSFIYAGLSLGNVEIAVTPALLAFVFSLTREIVKDIEDIAGDRENKARTLAVVWGIQKTKTLAASILLISLVGLFIPYILQIYGTIYLISITVSVFIPGLLLFYLLKNADSKDDFKRISSGLKWLILPSLVSITAEFIVRS